MNDSDFQTIKLGLENENLRQQNERLAFELKDLREEKPLLRRLRLYLPVLSWLVSVIAFPLAVYKYLDDRDAARKDEIKARDATQIDIRKETARPFWDKQLALYLEAAEKAAFIAVSKNAQQREEAKERFWVLYWGPLAAVEDIGITKRPNEVEKAMYEFGNLITKDAPDDRLRMEDAALTLAHAIREAVSPAFQLEPSDLDLKKLVKQQDSNP